MFQNFGVWQVLLILLVVLILFGVGRLPEVGRGLGKAIKEFRSSVGGSKSKKANAEISNKAETKEDKQSAS